MPIEQKHIDGLRDGLTNCALNTLARKPQQFYIDTLRKDIHEFCCEGRWTNLDQTHRGVWLGEIARRLQIAFSDPEAVLYTTSKGQVVKRKGLEEILFQEATYFRRILFTQFDINPNFKGQGGEAPAWLASKTILSAAEELRLSCSASKQLEQPNEMSNSLRIGLYLHAGKWATMNNRGYALHSLANVVPQRLVFRTAASLTSDESGRLNATMRHLVFRDSQPTTRRRSSEWEIQIPTSVIAVPVTKNDVNVVYTVKAIDMLGGAPDHGNETVMNQRASLVTGND